MNKYIMYQDRNLKTIQEYLLNAHRQNLKSMYLYNKKFCDTVHYSQLTKVLFHSVKLIRRRVTVATVCVYMCMHISPAFIS